MRTFHLPMSDELHDALRREAATQHRPATELVREALIGWMEARGRERESLEIERYAVEVAGTDGDLDPDLEEAAVEALLTGVPR